MDNASKHYDIIIIGAGPGGYELAARCAAAGKRVLVAEDREPGGTCLNRGCIPTKCLCASADVVRTVAAAGQFGVEVNGFKADYAAAHRRMEEVVAGLRSDVESILAGCTVVNARASITPEGAVKAGGEVYTATKIVIATGSEPALLNIPGNELAWTSDDFLRADSVPTSVVIVGGGVIGLEFASVLNAYGVEVTVIEYCKEVLPPFDAEVAKRLRTALGRQGINFVLGAAVKEICESGNTYTVHYEGRKGAETVCAERVLMAVGRRPVLPEGLAEAGIELNARGFIAVDRATMQTSRPGVYAVGDCNGLLMLAHAATAQSMVVAGDDVNLEAIPSAVFTHPEAAMVGLTTEKCKALGIPYASAKATFASNGKARAMAETEGLVKVLYDPETHRLLGCHIVGPHAADLVQEAALAITAGLTVGQVGKHTVHSHPSLGETVARAMASAK